MEIKTRKERAAVVVSLTGRMDAYSTPGFEKKLSDLIAEGEKNFIIDLGELDYISSTGLRIILTKARKLREKQGKLILAALKDMVKEVFESSGFSAIIPIYESVEAAMNK